MRIMGRRVVLSVLMVALVAPAQGSAIPAAASQPCAQGRLAFSSWRIPGTNGRSGWRPLAVDGNRVVMVEGPGDLVARPGPLTMAVVTAGSARYRPIPSGAYPHAGVLQRWQLSWPWLVGVFSRQSMPTLGWTLWAGNLQTGKHIVLASGTTRFDFLTASLPSALPCHWLRVAASSAQGIGRLELFTGCAVRRSFGAVARSLLVRMRRLRVAC